MQRAGSFGADNPLYLHLNSCQLGSRGILSGVFALVEVEWLGQVMVEARLAGMLLGRRLAIPRYGDDDDAAAAFILPELGGHFVAVHSGQADVEQDHVGFETPWRFPLLQARHRSPATRSRDGSACGWSSRQCRGCHSRSGCDAQNGELDGFWDVGLDFPRLVTQRKLVPESGDRHVGWVHAGDQARWQLDDRPATRRPDHCHG